MSGRQAIELADLTFDPPGKREADRRLRQALYLEDADCPSVWRQVKPLLREPQALADRMKGPQ